MFSLVAVIIMSLLFSFRQINHITGLLLFAGITEPVEVTDNGDGTHTVAYTPSVEGSYSVAVKYADEDVPRR